MPEFKDITSWSEHLGHSKLRSFTDADGHFWLEQNANKASKWAKLARQGGWIAAWHESPFFNDRERAALAWTEQLTLIAERGVPDEAYARAREHFSAEELVKLTLAVVQINGWNRFAISFRPQVGSYQPQQQKAAAIV